MSVIDGEPRTWTARVHQEAELSISDQRKFSFMVDEVPNFAIYVVEAMARRIRGRPKVAPLRTRLSALTRSSR
jgi:CRP/FNR family cyclic AMP-dependent transcriptional regulator